MRMVIVSIFLVIKWTKLAKKKREGVFKKQFSSHSRFFKTCLSFQFSYSHMLTLTHLNLNMQMNDILLGLFTTSKRPLKRANYLTNTPWRQSWENFAIFEQNVVCYGAMTGCPFLWFTHRWLLLSRMFILYSLVLADKRLTPWRRESTWGVGECLWTSTFMFQSIPSFNSSFTWVCSRLLNKWSIPSVMMRKTLSSTGWSTDIWRFVNKK